MKRRRTISDTAYVLPTPGGPCSKKKGMVERILVSASCFDLSKLLKSLSCLTGS